MRGKFTVELVAARQGDCVLVEWLGEERRIRMLIDAGPAKAYDSSVFGRLAALEDRRIDYLVVTHVDGDHVEGVVLLLRDADLGLSIGEVWYNGGHHLTNELGPPQGEVLTALIKARKLSWNMAFKGEAVCSSDGGLVVKELPGGVRATVLAPDRLTLRALRDEWEEACRKAHIDPGSDVQALRYLETRPTLSPKRVFLGSEPILPVEKLARERKGVDTSVSNASSIVLLLEYGQERVLLAGDSTPRALLPAVRRLLEERGVDTLALSVFKVPHHGSQRNVTAELVRMLPAQRYLISTDGSGLSKHPDDSAVATILEHGPPGLELIFNYDSPRNRRWSDSRLIATFQHRVSFPPEGQARPERTEEPS
ncbi:MAG: MBL fold metallo-hydrolase [Jatrophihabitantaceae bacterium]